MLIIYFSPEEVRRCINSRWLHFHGSGAGARSVLTSAQEGRLDHCDCRSELQPAKEDLKQWGTGCHRNTLGHDRDSFVFG